MFSVSIRAPLLVSLLGLLTPAAAFAQSAEPDHYFAVSKTAMAITGDIWMDGTGITFENDEYLEFKDFVANNIAVDGRRVSASVYSIAEPDDPELENGNRLCGSGKVTYLASWTSGKDMTTVAVFTGRNAPKNSGEMCASYTYEDPQ